jgi:ribose 5-phosphate isomerase B
MQKIFFGSDHGGYQLKEKIKQYLQKKGGYEIIDIGCGSPDSCDYPLFGGNVADAVVHTQGALGIIICGSGVGISIAANKVQGARAVLANSIELAQLGRQHNGANILAMGERTKFIDKPEKIVDTFLSTSVDEAPRHARRRELLDKM